MSLPFVAWPGPRSGKSSTMTREIDTHVNSWWVFRIAQLSPDAG